MRSLLFALTAIVSATQASALPEAQLGTRHTGDIVAILSKNSFRIDQAKSELATTGIAALDTLWANAKHFKTKPCSDGEQAEGCLWMSRFDLAAKNNPVVILPGFTEYRKQYLEFVHDLGTRGYGPVYVLDFRSHGQSFKPFLKNGERLQTVGEYVASEGDKVTTALTRSLVDASKKTYGKAHYSQLESTVKSLPVGLGDGKSYYDFAWDVNTMLTFATTDLAAMGNRNKITVMAHSTGGMAMLVALGRYDAAWLKQIERMVLMVPLVGVAIKQAGIPIPSSIIEIVHDTILEPGQGERAAYADRGVGQFVNKSLGIFAPENSVSHSPDRLTLSDSIRVWNGYETVGGTRRWVKAMLDTEYRSIDPLGKQLLNRMLPTIRTKLQANGIDTVVLSSGADTIARTESTASFMKALSKKGLVTRYCNVDGARHVIHQESDLYRSPFMKLLGSFNGLDLMDDLDRKRLGCVTLGR